jgi:thiol-disulfide isomerase/thioredoxin
MNRGLTRRGVLAAGAGLVLGGGGPARAAVDWPALTLLDGRTLSPEAWRGSAAVLVFWATWCAFCHRHNVHVEKLHRAAAGLPLRVLGVALDRDAAAVQHHLAARGFTFPVTLQADALRPLAGGRRITPLTVAVTRSGAVRTPIPGEMFEEDVLELARLAGDPA